LPALAKRWPRRGQSSRTERVTLAVIVAYVAAVLVLPLLINTSPSAIDFAHQLKGPSGRAWFGTDDLGRDLFVRVVLGARTSMLAAVVIVIPAAIIGIAIGTIAGFWGGFVDAVLMRFTDLVLAFPYLILALVVAAILGPSLPNAILSLVVVWWPSFARIARGLVVSIKENEFVTASRALGASRTRIILRDVLPHAWGPLQTKMLVDFGYAMIALASLSFIGLGAQPPSPELGALILQARDYVLDAWWYGVFPGLAVLVPVAALNVYGDARRDRQEGFGRTREVVVPSAQGVGAQAPEMAT
jgi:peptide/nickel transport system permease protein